MFWYLSVIFCLKSKRYLEDSRVNLLVLAVEDVLDKLHIVCPHSHLEAAGNISNIDLDFLGHGEIDQ